MVHKVVSLKIMYITAPLRDFGGIDIFKYFPPVSFIFQEHGINTRKTEKYFNNLVMIYL